MALRGGYMCMQGAVVRYEAAAAETWLDLPPALVHSVAVTALPSVVLYEVMQRPMHDRHVDA
jgi:hypothetical protein